MSTIGTFTMSADGSYSGAIHTLSLNLKSVQFRPNEKAQAKSPDFRIFTGKAELGAAWKQTTDEGRDYLSVRLDDPRFDKEINAALFDADDGYELVWTRSRPAD